MNDSMQISNTPWGHACNSEPKINSKPPPRRTWTCSTKTPSACVRTSRIRAFDMPPEQSTLCCRVNSEVLARIAIKARAQIFDRNRARCARNLSELEAFFQRWRHLYQWKSPPGSCVGFVRYLGSDGVEAHCRDLVEQSGVLLLPASVYQSDLLPVVKDYFRVGYGREGLDAGLGAWDRHLSRIM